MDHARVIDGTGQLGLVEISAVPGTREASVQGDTIAAAFNVAEGINPASTLIPVTRIEGSPPPSPFRPAIS